MTDRSPYEDSLADKLADLPLPDENMAWEDMRRRLDKDDRRRVIPFWLPGCGLWGALLLVAIGLCWVIFRPETFFNNKKKKAVNESRITSPQQPRQGSTSSQADSITDDRLVKKSQQDTKGIVIEKWEAKSQSPVVVERTRGESDPSQMEIELRAATNRRQRRSEITQSKPVSTNDQQQGNRDSDVPYHPATSDNGRLPPVAPKTNDAVPSEKPPAVDSLTAKDSAQLETDTGRTDSLPQPEQKKKDSSAKKQFYFAAGLGMHQLVPVDGQKLTPYNSAGRKSSLADYIPSIYFRLYREDRWFVHAEFRYGAPQYNREILYDEGSRIDTIAQVEYTTLTSTKLKKTFYHQVPVSFNYFLAKDWSVGGGFVWNKFVGAISERDVNRRNNFTQIDSMISKGVIVRSSSSDSNFVKSYFHASVETQYRKGRFTLGARYAFGLQPYLRFNVGGGQVQQEKNKNLQLFLRYELWRSRKK